MPIDWLGGSIALLSNVYRGPLCQNVGEIFTFAVTDTVASWRFYKLTIWRRLSMTVARAATRWVKVFPVTARLSGSVTS